MGQHRTRKSLTSQQEEYIERITKPKTPEDVVLALQNPLTAIYKDAMNMLIAQMHMDIIIEKLIQHYLIHDLEVREEEKEELIKAMILSEAKRAIHRDILQIPAMIQYTKSIETQDLHKARQQWEKHTAIVKDLKEKITRFENELFEIEESENILKQEWKHIAEEIRAVYVEHLQEQNLSFVGADGEKITIESDKGKKVIDIRSGIMSSPLEVIKAVKSSIEIAKEQNLFLPEEFREPSKDPNMLVEYQSMMDELKAVAEAAKTKREQENTGAILYDVSKSNREQFKIRSNLPNLPNAPRNFTIKKSAELAYTKSLLTQSKMDDENKKENEDKVDVILPNKSIVKQRSGFLSELSGLGADVEGKTGPELLKALREKRQRQVQQKVSEIATDASPNITVKQRVVLKIEIDPNAPTSNRLDSINSIQVRLMGDSLALLDSQRNIKEKLHHAKINLEFAERLVSEDTKLCNKIISKEVKNEEAKNEPIKANSSAKQKDNL